MLLRYFAALGLLARIALAQDPPVERKDSIVVIGTYEPVPLKESDRAVTVFDLDGTKRLLFGSVTDVLRLDPSIDLQQRAPNGVQTDLSIRGGSFAQTLVLLNGFRLDDAQSAHHDMDIPVPLQAISRIEILKGSGSAFYGSDAVDGAIDIIARPPQSTEFRLSSALGNFGVNRESASLSLLTKQVAAELSFSRDFSTGFMPDRDYRNLQIASLTYWKTKLGATDLLLSTGDKPFGANQFYGNFDSWERTRQWFASIHQELGSKMEFDFGYRRHTDLFVLFREDPQIYTNRHADESYQTAVRRNDSLGLNASIHYGVEGYRDTIQSNNLGYRQRNRGAAYAALDFRALGRFSLSIAAREELYTLASIPGTHAQFSPTVSGGVWLSPAIRLRASASSAFRLPSYTDLYYLDPANAGNPALRPEHAATYEGGMEWFRGSRFRAYATFFNRRERDGIDYVRTNPNAIWQAANIDRLNFTGLETGLTARLPHSQEVVVECTVLHGTQDLPGALMTKYTFNYPSQNASVRWEAALPRGFVARTRIGALNRRERSPYALWDLYAASTRGRVHPFLQLTNLSNTGYRDIIGIPMQGRAVVGGVEYLVFGKSR